MTYLMPRRPTRLVRRKASLSDWWGEPSDEMKCLDQANAQVAPFDAKIGDLARTWNPTGFYTPEEVRTIVTSTTKLTRQAYEALTKAAAEPNAGGESIDRATNDLGRAGQRSLDYLAAATQAEQQGFAVVNAPGFKRWVTDTMNATSSAMVTAAVVLCLTPWWITALARFMEAADVVFSVIKRVIGAVLKTGDLALKVPDLVEDMLSIAKWGVGLGAAAWILHALLVKRAAPP
jgi:hypothetical protein